MKHTYYTLEIKIIALKCEDIVTASSGDVFQTDGEYDGSNMWNGFCSGTGF